MNKIWIELRSSLWFVPGLLVIGGGLLALAVVQLDVAFAATLHAKSWAPLLNAGAEGARGMLSSIAGSMITVAGLAFSITIVTLSLASTQYTPRILRTFMRDRANQIVLGVFLAVFTYCLIVMRTIRGGAEKDGGGFVPLLAVALALALALVSIGCLIFFIHHVAASIQASTILKAIETETLAATEHLFPQELGTAPEDVASAREAAQEKEWHMVPAKGSGYLQHLDAAGLMDFARGQDLTLRLEIGPGDFAAAGAPLVAADRKLDEPQREALRRLFVVGDFRTTQQDASFGIRQIVDIALKALSPGINDPTTAVSCLDYLGAILLQLARRRLASHFREDAGGRLRVLAPVTTFADYVAEAFDQIRLAAAGSVAVYVQLFRVLARVAPATAGRPARRASLLVQARLVAETAGGEVEGAYDRARIDAALLALRAALGADAAALPALPVR